MTTKTKKCGQRLKPLSLYPIKAEEALALFIQVDPKPVKAGMQKLRRKKTGRQHIADGLIRKCGAVIVIPDRPAHVCNFF